LKLSKDLRGIRLVPVEIEVGGKAPAKSAKALWQLFAPGLCSTPNSSSSATWIFDLVARFQF
jgi:hypothetical protein